MKTLFVVLIISFSHILLASTSLKFKENFKIDDIIWGFEWLDDQNMLLTLKGGRLVKFNTSTKKQIEIKHDLKFVDAGQGGLLDVVKDTSFAKTNLIFFTYATEDAKKEAMTTELAQAEFSDEGLKNKKVLATANAWSDNKIHFGSRIVVQDDVIFFSVGDRNERDLAQDSKLENGKVLRIDRKTLQKTVFSLGHRNPQGLTRHPETGELWLSEHGPRGGDEINLVVEGRNYGWPVVTYGKEYWGPKVSDFTTKKGFEDPVHQMTPSIAPSSIMIYSGKKYPAYKGHFFVGALVKKHLAVFEIKDKKLVSEVKLVENLKERIRNVKESPAGDIVFSTDSGKLFWSE